MTLSHSTRHRGSGGSGHRGCKLLRRGKDPRPDLARRGSASHASMLYGSSVEPEGAFSFPALSAAAWRFGWGRVGFPLSGIPSDVRWPSRISAKSAIAIVFQLGRTPGHYRTASSSELDARPDHKACQEAAGSFVVGCVGSKERPAAYIRCRRSWDRRSGPGRRASMPAASMACSAPKPQRRTSVSTRVPHGTTVPSTTLRILADVEVLVYPVIDVERGLAGGEPPPAQAGLGIVEEWASFAVHRHSMRSIAPPPATDA